MAHEFITKFHEIEGESIGQRQRNLNSFLKNVSIAPHEKHFILDNLHPKTYLENLFYIDVLIYLRETSRLLEIFKDGNEVFVSKIMKQPWFFQEAFNNISPKALVDDFLPLLSFSMKIKLLRNLSHIYTEEKIDEIFDYVENRYGLFMTDPFITACSSEKVNAVLKNYKVKLSTHQLKTLYKKEPNLINIYLAEQRRYNKDIFDSNFLTYLAQRNPDYFWKLIEKYKISQNLKLGRRTTKKLISVKTEEIVNDPQKYMKYLRHETLVRKLNKQGHFQQLYYNLFPTKIEKLESGDDLCNTILKYYPKRAQYDLYTKTFNDIINDDIWNYTSCIHDNLLQLISDIKVKEAWAQLKYKESSNEEYIKFYEFDKAITLIKEKINVASSIKKRSILVSVLVKSCAINKHLNYLENLEEVLKYFCSRHKNDDKLITSEFLQAIENNFDLKELTTTHWKYIKKIFTKQSINKEYGVCGGNFRLKHIEYLFNNNGSEEDKTYFVLEYIKEQVESSWLSFNEFDVTKNTEIQKFVLLTTMEHIDTLMNTPKGYYRPYLKSQLITNILCFNEKHPEDSINTQEYIIQYLRDISSKLEHVPYTFEFNFSRIIRKINRNDFENDLLNFYLRNKQFRGFLFDSALRWYLKYDPMVILNNFDSIMEVLPLKAYVWTNIKRYSHLSLDEMSIKHCRNLLEHGGNDHNPQIFQPLSILENPDCYIKTMENFNFMPITSKVNVNDPEAKKMYQIQRAFLRNLQNVWNPTKYLALLIDKFCEGDYLRESLTPLYFAFHKTPENKLEFYLDKLAENKAISVKKHSLFLASCVFEQRKVSKIFDSFQENKNESLQKRLCLSSLRYFTKIQTREYFDKLLSYLNFLRECDTELLEILSSAEIPINYKPYYKVNLWNLLEKLKANPNAIGFNKLMSTVLNNIDAECIQNLSEDFCREIINNYFGTSVKEGDEICNIPQFVTKFLMYHKNRTDNFNYVFKLLSYNKFWELKAKERNVIHTFFNVFFTTVYEEEMDLEFVNKFSEEWKKVFSESETFKEHVLLNVLRFKKEAKDNIELYSKYIVDYTEEVSAKYGEFVFSKFIPIIAGFCIFGSNEKEITKLLTAILKYKTSTLNCILVMELIKDDLFYKNKIRLMYRDIYLVLKQITDSKAQLCYNLYSENEC